VVELVRKNGAPHSGEAALYAPHIEYAIYRECTPEWQMPRQKLRAWDITYVVKGSAEYLINGENYRAVAGDLLCMPQGSIRQGHTFPENLMTCYSVNFRLVSPNGEATTLPFPVLSHIGYKPEIEHLFQLFFYAWQERRPGYRLETGGLFLLILHHLFELTIYNTDTSDEDWRIRKVTRYISQHYADRISVRQMADMVGLNTVYFGALFKRQTGFTMNQYLMKIRVSNAESLLQTGEYSVNDVAEYCGFANIAHFFKHFKALTGEAPSSRIPGRSIRF
jgi:AraC-like DNA-binding protein